MVLFQDVIQILPSDHLDWYRAAKAFRHLVYGFDASRVSSVFVDGSLSRVAVDLQQLREKYGGGGFVSTLRKHEIKCLSVPVDSAIVTDLRSFYLDASLFHSPGTVARSLSPARDIGNCTSVFCDPRVQCCMIQINAAFRHDFFQVTARHTVSKVEENCVQDDVFRKCALERDRRDRLPSYSSPR